MDQLKIYKVADKYVSFLHGADNRVQHNKGMSRPYVGIVLIVGSYRYFVPMESPKEQHKKLRPSVHIMPIENGRYGLLGFNNMIPVPYGAVTLMDIDAEPDRKYAELLKRQATFINRHKADVYARAQKTYFRATTKKQDNFFRKICCDFKKLERVSERYDPGYRPKR